MTRVFQELPLHRFVPSALLFSAMAFATACPANAQSADSNGLYANIGVTQLSADLDLSDLSTQGTAIDLGQQSAKINMITGRLGYRFADYIAIEGEAGFGLGGDSFQQTVPVAVSGLGTVDVDTDVDLDVTNYAGIFARGILPVADQFDLFARVGYGTAKAEASAVGTTALLPGFSATASESDSVSDFAYGVGAQFNIDETNGIRLDYASIGGDFSVISISYAISF